MARKKAGSGPKGGGSDAGKSKVTRVIPDVAGVRAWHQVARYLYSDQGFEEKEHGYPYPYPLKAYCRFCKLARGAWPMPEGDYMKMEWQEADGTPVMSMVEEETRLEVLEWVKRRGKRWKKVWKARRKEGVAEAAYLRSRRAERRGAEELARMRVDAENTDVTDDESANLESDEDCVLGVSY